MLLTTGMSQRDVAKHFEVSTTTIRKWTDAWGRSRRSRADDIELEREKMIGQMEAVANRAWTGVNSVAANSMTGPSYLKTIIEAAQVIIKLRGLDLPVTREGGGRQTTVVVRFGGTAGGGKEQIGGIQGAIDVAVQESVAS